MLVPILVIPGIGGDLSFNVQGIAFTNMLFHYFSSLVPYHDAVPFGSADLLAFLVTPHLVGGQGKIGHKGLPVPFRNPGHFPYVPNEGYTIYSVFHNA